MEDFIDFVGGPPPLGDISFLFCSTYLRQKRERVVGAQGLMVTVTITRSATQSVMYMKISALWENGVLFQ